MNMLQQLLLPSGPYVSNVFAAPTQLSEHAWQAYRQRRQKHRPAVQACAESLPYSGIKIPHLIELTLDEAVDAVTLCGGRPQRPNSSGVLAFLRAGQTAPEASSVNPRGCLWSPSTTFGYDKGVHICTGCLQKIDATVPIQLYPVLTLRNFCSWCSPASPANPKTAPLLPCFHASPGANSHPNETFWGASNFLTDYRTLQSGLTPLTCF